MTLPIVALALVTIGLLVLVFYMVSAATKLIENTLAGVWRIATASTSAYIVFDNGAINLMEIDESKSQPLQLVELALDATYKFMYKPSRLIGEHDDLPYELTISIPTSAAADMVRKYALNKIFVPGKTITCSLNPSMGVLIATNDFETLQLIKDNELSIQYLS